MNGELTFRPFFGEILYLLGTPFFGIHTVGTAKEGGMHHFIDSTREEA